MNDVVLALTPVIVCIRLHIMLCVFCRRVCGRKRKGTPVKVCERVAYVTEDEEESLSEHSYSPGTKKKKKKYLLEYYLMCQALQG